jgi:hypothetical protein
MKKNPRKMKNRRTSVTRNTWPLDEFTNPDEEGHIGIFEVQLCIVAKVRNVNLLSRSSTAHVLPRTRFVLEKLAIVSDLTPDN